MGKWAHSTTPGVISRPPYSGGRGTLAVLAIVASGTMALCACVSVMPGARFQIADPSALSDAASSVDMRVALALAEPADEACPAVLPSNPCDADIVFERHVAALGTRLAGAAYAAYPDLMLRHRTFSFGVADKREPGSASDASGAVVVFRGVRTPHLDEVTLAFLIAREMGHVIARHHDERLAVRIVATIMAQLVMPIADLIRSTDALVGSAASAAGTQVISAASNDERRREADAIALRLLAHQGWRRGDIANSLSAYATDLPDDSWSLEIKNAIGDVKLGADR